MIVSSTIIVVDPTADLQEAVDNTPAGGILRLGPGTFTVPSGGLLISRGIHIIGSGRQQTILAPYEVAANQPVIKFAEDASITPDINDVVISDLSIHGGAVDQDNAPAVLAGSYGIDCTLDAGQIVRHIKLDRLYIWRCSNDGLHVTGNGADTAVIGLRVIDCVINENWGDGMYVQGATLVHSSSNLCAQNYGRGQYFDSCLVTSEGDYVEANCHSAALVAGYDGQATYYLGVINVSGLTCEAFNTETGSVYLRQQATMTGLSLQTVSGSVRACKFYNAVSVGNVLERGIFIDNNNPSALEIGVCMFDGCYFSIYVVNNGTVRGTSIAHQNLHSYDAIISSALGLIVPLTSSGQRIAALPTYSPGQLIYNTTDGAMNVWNGYGWRQVVAGAISYEDDAVMYDDEPVTG